MTHSDLAPSQAPGAPRPDPDGLRSTLWVGVWVGLWFGLTLWMRPLALPDEGRYVGVALEMWQRGDLSVPTLDGLPFFHKPPLFYWITAVALQVFGVGVAAARLAPWLAATLTCAALYAFLRRWDSPGQARRAVIVLATLPLFYGGSQFANLDMLVAGCISVTILALAHAMLARERGDRARGAMIVAYGVAGCGVLAKGLIGVVLPGLVIVVWALATRRVRRLPSLLFWWPGWLLFAAVAVPWYVRMQQRFPDFNHYVFMVQQVERFAKTGYNNVQPFWFYPAVLLLLAAPWTLLGWRAWRARAAETNAPAQDLRRLMICWLGAILVFFTLPSSKLVGYILPVVPPLAVLLAGGLRRTGGDATHPSGGERTLYVLAGVAGLVCVLAVTAAHYKQPKSLAALGTSLKTLRQGQEPVFYLGGYYYDVAFYAGLAPPIHVVDDWAPAEVAKDSWRRELIDAQGFTPDALPRRLLPSAAMAPALCAAPVSFVIAPWPASTAWPIFSAVPPQVSSGTRALWRIDSRVPAARAALGCG